MAEFNRRAFSHLLGMQRDSDVGKGQASGEKVAKGTNLIPHSLYFAFSSIIIVHTHYAIVPPNEQISRVHTSKQWPRIALEN